MPTSSLEQIKNIPEGNEGIRVTVKNMRMLVDEGKKKWKILQIASDVVKGVPERNHKAEVNALFNWVKSNIRFIQDPDGAEMLMAPLYTIQRGAGDCDDLSTLLNTLAAAIGYRTKFVTIKADKNYPDRFSHVYSKILIDGRWVPADPSQKDKPLGWEPPKHYGLKSWKEGETTGVGTVSGLGYLGGPRMRNSQFISALLGKNTEKRNTRRETGRRKHPVRLKRPKERNPYSKDYYGAGGSEEPPGVYGYAEVESLAPDRYNYRQLIPVRKLPVVDPWGDKHSDDVRFQGRQKTYNRKRHISPFHRRGKTTAQARSSYERSYR